MRWVVVVLGAAMWFSGSLMIAQTAADPTLHRRDVTSQPDKPAAAKPRAHSGFSTLPGDASGEYLIDEAGSTVEITIDSGKVSGYVTKMGDERSDKDTPLTFFFDQATVDGNRVTFTTKKIHGIWYSFDGGIVRGDLKTTREENGYYLLRGAWTTHDDARNAQSRDQVSLKATPREN